VTGLPGAQRTRGRKSLPRRLQSPMIAGSTYRGGSRGVANGSSRWPLRIPKEPEYFCALWASWVLTTAPPTCESRSITQSSVR
jgi:hypothetical protein